MNFKIIVSSSANMDKIVFDFAKFGCISATYSDKSFKLSIKEITEPFIKMCLKMVQTGDAVCLLDTTKGKFNLPEYFAKIYDMLPEAYREKHGYNVFDCVMAYRSSKPEEIDRLLSGDIRNGVYYNDKENILRIVTDETISYYNIDKLVKYDNLELPFSPDNMDWKYFKQ